MVEEKEGNRQAHIHLCELQSLRRKLNPGDLSDDWLGDRSVQLLIKGLLLPGQNNLGMHKVF